MRYFKIGQTEEDAAKIFRALSKSMHPDNGGDGADFATMKSEYDDYKAIRRHSVEITDLINKKVREALQRIPPRVVTEIKYVNVPVEVQVPVVQKATIEKVGNFINDAANGLKIANSLFSTLSNLMPNDSDDVSIND